MIYVVVIEQRDAVGKLVSEDFISRTTLGREAAFKRESVERPIVDRGRFKAVIRFFDKWCEDCNGRGYNTGDCHPQEWCGACDGNGAVTEGRT